MNQMRDNLKEKTPFYKKIRVNHYLVAKLPKDDVPDCNCNSKDSCSENVIKLGVSFLSKSLQCLNRTLNIECDPKTCPAGDGCQNTRIQKRASPKLIPFKTECSGWGLKCATDLKPVFWKSCSCFSVFKSFLAGRFCYRVYR